MLKLMKFIGITIGVLVIGLVGITACSSPAHNASIPSAPAHTSAPAPAAAVSKPDGTPSHPLPFGATSLSGVDLTVSAPAKYTPSESAFEDPKMPSAVVLTVTVKNNSQVAVSAATDVSFAATADNTDASQIADDGLDSEGNILPGHTLSWKVGFGVPSAAKTLTVTANWDFGTLDTNSVYFEGPLS